MVWRELVLALEGFRKLKTQQVFKPEDRPNRYENIEIKA
jgi:hypothetical protein